MKPRLVREERSVHSEVQMGPKGQKGRSGHGARDEHEWHLGVCGVAAASERRAPAMLCACDALSRDGSFC